MRQLLKATFGKLTRVKPLDFSSVTAKATILPLDGPIEEERVQDYHSRNFYPVKLGEIFNDTRLHIKLFVKLVLVSTRLSGLLGTFIGACLFHTNLDDIEVSWDSFKDRYAFLKICTSDDVNEHPCVETVSSHRRRKTWTSGSKLHQNGKRFLQSTGFEGTTHVSCL